MMSHDISALIDFTEKYRTARNFNSKEIRLTIQEAEQIAIAISIMFGQETELSRKIIALQEQIQNGIEVRQDGGKF